MGTELTQFTRGESSTATTESNVESNLQIDICQLRIGSAISVGPNSNVYKGSYKQIPVAIKIIQRNEATNIVSPERTEKFQREVRLLSKVQHDNIVKFIGFTMKPSLTLVTEFMGGGSLQKHLSNIKRSLDLKDALTFALGISRAMEHLHDNGIIHRHLKPSNIFLTEDKKSVKVGDFGVCREGVEGDLSPEVGTLPWMAPEVFINQCGLQQLLNMELHEIGRWKPKYNHKVDVFSFSLVLWEMLTNNTPFKGLDDFMMRYAVAGKPRPSLDRIPAHIHSLLTSCWAVDPEQRPEFAQISQILEELLTNISTSRARTQEILPDSETNNISPCHARTEENLPDSETKESTTFLSNTVKKIRKSLCCWARTEESLPDSEHNFLE